MSNFELEVIAKKLGNGKEFLPEGGRAYFTMCPCHEDTVSTLKIWEGPEGQLRFACAKGCSRNQIKETLEKLLLNPSANSEGVASVPSSPIKEDCGATVNYSLQDAIDRARCTSTQLFSMKLREPISLIAPIISEGSLTLMYSRPGIGKSWIVHNFAVGLTRENFEDIMIGKLKINKPGSVLLVDGELPLIALQKRLLGITNYMGRESDLYRLNLISGVKVSELSGASINISHQESRNYITKALESDPLCRLLILDNLSTLTKGRNENSKANIDPIIEWMISLRSRGVAVILVHHANKAGHDRGTSAIRDCLDTVIRLEKEETDRVDLVQMVAVFEKGRNLMRGEGEDLSFRLTGTYATGFRLIDPSDSTLDSDEALDIGDLD